MVSTHRSPCREPSRRQLLRRAVGAVDHRGRPVHPHDLLGHACLRGRFPSGAILPWEFERDGEVVRVDPAGPLLVSIGPATDLAVDAAIAGTGII
jgi:hypothetical protein